MPGHQKPSSEYNKKFRWNDSFRSTSFTPMKDQKHPIAGLASTEFGKTQAYILEPPLQRKRKPLDPEAKMTYTTKQYFNTPPTSEDGSAVQRKVRIPNKSKKIDSPRYTGSKHKHSKHDTEQAKVITQDKHGTVKTTHIIDQDQPPQERLQPALKVTNGHGLTNGHGQEGKTKEKPLSHSHRSSSGSPKNKETDVDAALQYQAGIRTRPLGLRYLSEYQRQFKWTEPSKESPLIAAEQMIHSSNTNLAPFDPGKIPKRTEYMTQYKPLHPSKPAVHEQLLENAQREMKAKYLVKTKSKKSKKLNQLTPDKMKTAGVPSVLVHEDSKLLKSAQNPQRPFFPHANIRKWKSEYRSNFKPPTLFSYEDGVWRGANPPHIQPREEASDTNNLRHAKSEGDIPNWFAEVLELRQKAEQYQTRARGTHFSRDHMAQLIAEQAKLWEQSSTAPSTSSITTSLSETEANEDKYDKSAAEQLRGKNQHAQQTKEAPSNNQESAAVRRRLAWNDDKGVNGSRGDAGGLSNGFKDEERRLSFDSIPTPAESKESLSSRSDDFSIISGEGRQSTPRLQQEGNSRRHHLDKTTPSTGGALLSSPPAKKEALRHSAPAFTTAPSGHHHQHLRTYAAEPHKGSAPSSSSTRDTAIIPGGITKGFSYVSTDDDDEGGGDRTLTPSGKNSSSTPVKSHQQHNFLKGLQTSPSFGKVTKDPHPLSSSLTSSKFQRHSSNYFETSARMPVMPGKIEPPRTWAAPRLTTSRGDGPKQNGLLNGKKENRLENGEIHKDEGVQNQISKPQTRFRKGPLDRPSSGSVYGRPQTAYPQTRESAAKVSDQEGRPNSFMAGDGVHPGKTYSSNNKKRQGSAELPGQNGYLTPQNAGHNISDMDSDEMSLSNLSIRSDCSSSLASEVLDRARKRRDNFWGK